MNFTIKSIYLVRYSGILRISDTSNSQVAQPPVSSKTEGKRPTGWYVGNTVIRIGTSEREGESCAICESLHTDRWKSLLTLMGYLVLSLITETMYSGAEAAALLKR